MSRASLFSLAGFQVTFNGRFWVTAEVIGPKLKSRSFSRQITEIQLGQKVLNTMTALGRPVFERIA